MIDPILEKLQRQLSKLPGLGPRSAKRMMLNLLLHKSQQLKPLIDMLQEAHDKTIFCYQCGNLSSINPCPICQDPKRDKTTICVVENVSDLWALERSNIYHGQYHVLGGVISALDNITPEDLEIESLLSRIENTAVTEIILAINVTLEGQTTALYLKNKLQSCDVNVTRLAHGLPAGGELDYMDDSTLLAALQARNNIP